MVIINTHFPFYPTTMVMAVAAFNSPVCFSLPQEQAQPNPLFIRLRLKPSCKFNRLANNPKPRPKILLHEHTIYANLPIQFKEKIIFLEIMGVDSGKAFCLNPDLHSATLPSIQNNINFLQSKGILHEDLPKILGMCPKILTADINNDLIPVFDFLSHYLRVPDHKYRKVINRCPRLLVSSVENQLKPALFYLLRLGFRDLRILAYQDCGLLVSSVETTLIPKLDYLMSLGFSKWDVVGMALRCPGLLTFSIEKSYKPKFDYFDKEMGGELNELKEFPQFFGFSLDKRIKPRHLQAVECGVKIPLSLLLKTRDEEFTELLTRQKEEGQGN